MKEAKDCLDSGEGLCCLCNTPVEKHTKQMLRECVFEYIQVHKDSIDQACRELPRLIRVYISLKVGK